MIDQEFRRQEQEREFIEWRERRAKFFDVKLQEVSSLDLQNASPSFMDEIKLLTKKKKEFTEPNPRDYKKEYHDYLKSPRWERTRERIFKKRGGKCEVCGSTENLAVHHKKYNGYKRDVKDSELQLLCKSCHYEQHKEELNAIA